MTTATVTTTLDGQEVTTMKAARIHRFGDPSVIQLDDAPVPQLASGEVRIKIHAAGVNRLEHYIRNGEFLTEDQIAFLSTRGLSVEGANLRYPLISERPGLALAARQPDPHPDSVPVVPGRFHQQATDQHVPRLRDPPVGAAPRARSSGGGQDQMLVS